MTNQNKIDQLKAFLTMDANDGFTRFALAMEYRKAGKLEEARSTFRDLLKRDPDYVGAYYHLGKLLSEMGFDDEARFIYEKGVECAIKIHDQHAASELRQALAELDWND